MQIERHHDRSNLYKFTATFHNNRFYQRNVPTAICLSLLFLTMFTVTQLLVLSIVLRIGFFSFGLYQDAYMTVKYTDIDYLVFSDAASYVSAGGSPYQRDTYRYTPLLAWLLVPNSWGGAWYSFGKALFVLSDIITGYFVVRLLQGLTIKGKKLSDRTVMGLSAIWLLNPVVITISTRGSAESVLSVMKMASLYNLLERKSVVWSALWLGLAIHFKIYPVIYLPSFMLYLSSSKPLVNLPLVNLLNRTNLSFLAITLATVSSINALMYYIYGFEFLEHSYLYHLTRIDHRHNFSVYNIALYYQSALLEPTHTLLSFLPQLGLSGIVLPLLFARKDLISSCFLQTIAFVTFNKVMTSQYFIWFLIFLPHYLAHSDLITSHKLKGIAMFVAWVATQGIWLNFGYNLEFLGQNSYQELHYAAIAFFLTNCWILGEFIYHLV